eukprot:c1170_g1_i1 orf=202-363(+)
MPYTGSKSVLVVSVYRSSSLSQRLKHPYRKHLVPVVADTEPTDTKGTHPHTQT